MATPRIGRSVATETPAENALIAASNALGYQARKLRQAATGANADFAAQEAVLDRLRVIGSQEASATVVRDQAQQAASRSKIQPAVDDAHALLAALKPVRVRATSLLDATSSIQWENVIRRFPEGHGVVPGSDMSTRNRIGHLRRAIADLRDLAVVGTDASLDYAVRAVEQVDDVESSAGKQVCGNLRREVDHARGRAAGIDTAIVNVQKMIVKLADVILPVDAPADNVEVC